MTFQSKLNIPDYNCLIIHCDANLNKVIICNEFFNLNLASTVDCSGDNPCMNGAACDNNACTCTTGFTGTLCDTGNKQI